jgi:multidrug resistance efflux pump
MEEETAGRIMVVRQLWYLLLPVALVFAFLALRQRGLLERIPLLQPAPGTATEQSQTISASGIIEVDEVSVSSEFGGRIVSIAVSPGQTVAAGDTLVQLDTSAIDAQIEAAEAAVDWAEAGLAQAEAGVRPGQIAVAEAQLAQAQAAHAAATKAVSDTLALVENPQDIRLQVAVAQAQAEAAQHQVQQATAMKDAAEVAKNTFEDVNASVPNSGRKKVHVSGGSIEEAVGELPDVDLSQLSDGTYTFGEFEVEIHDGNYELYKWVNISIPLEMHLTPNKWWQAWVGVNAASAQYEGAQASLGQLYSQLQNPLTLEAQVDQAVSAAAQAEAQIAVAQAQVDALQAGARPEELAALEARVAEARTALESLRAQRQMMQVTAPLPGVVVNVNVHPGEVAAATGPLLTIADLSTVRLVVYLPEAQIARTQLGQPVEVAVDSFPGQLFEGEVSHIASQAEFTPRNVATTEERATLVYAVEIRLENEDGSLKPGMPADVVLGAS